MQRVITPEESARLDAAAAVPIEVLMDRAGLAVALGAVRMGARYGSRVAVLAGPGNNGGDGYVAARYLAQRGAMVTIHTWGTPAAPDSASGKAEAAARRQGIAVVPLGEPIRADLVIDALFGAGFRGSLPDDVVAWTGVGAPVLAVDVPSGLNAATGETEGPCFTATRTVTFHAYKVGHLLGEGPDRCGVVDVANIGLTGGRVDDTRARLRLCEGDDALRPGRARTDHKWSAGSVLVVGGAPGLTGAPVLAARAALHFGAGAAAIACPGGLQSVFESLAPGVMTVAVGDGVRFDAADAGQLLRRSERYGVLAVGPGMGREQAKFVASLIAERSGPLVIDADGLNALRGPEQLSDRDGETVITPHAGEFRRLADEEPGLESVERLAADAASTVLLKGNPTIVAGADAWVVTTGGPELATIGSGDVLTGMVAALMGRGLDADQAARSAAYWHGVAGARLAARSTVVAEELAAEVGTVAW